MGPFITDGMIVVAILAGTTTVTGFALLARAWFRAHDRALRAESALAALVAERASSSPEQVAARFDRVDDALELLSLEVERVAEAERFQTKLLSGRRGAVGEGRVITPH